MTREDILAMKPGKKLDALVAEKIGLTVNKANAGIFDDGGLYITEHHRYKPFRPSTSIDAAWKVVEKMNDKIHWFGVEIHKPGYRAIFRVKGKRVDKDWFESYAETATEAICKAALLAILEVE